MNNSRITYEQILSHFQFDKRNGNKIQARCPAHEDKHASLSIDLIEGKVLIFCHAGCPLNSVLQAAGLETKDLFLNGDKPPEAIYQYRNLDGSFSHQKLKYRNADGSKEFRPWRLDGNKWAVNLDGITRQPYNYPFVYKAIKTGAVIVKPEGEKDADTAQLLGYTGTTTGGASDWKPEYKNYFKNARMIVIPDKDDPGMKHASKVVKDLETVCQSLKVVILPEGKDLTEWVETGKGRNELDDLIKGSPELIKSENRKTDWHDNLFTSDDLLDAELQPITFIVEGLIAKCSVNILAGKKKLGKSWLALQLAQCISTGQPFLGMNTIAGPVLYLALEDGKQRLKQRLNMQHVNRGQNVAYVMSVQPLNTKAGRTELIAMIIERKPSLIIIDTFKAATNKKVDENESGSTGDLFNDLHTISQTYDIAILFVSHHGKASTGDVGFDIRGSSAIPGATDCNIGLYYKDDHYSLESESRDADPVNIRIKLDKEITWTWQFEGNANDLARQESEQKIVDAIDEYGGQADVNQIAEYIGISRVAVQNHVKRMCNECILHSELEKKSRKLIYSVISDIDIR